jgi:hypothetical protein
MRCFKTMRNVKTEHLRVEHMPFSGSVNSIQWKLTMNEEESKMKRERALFYPHTRFQAES